MTTLDELVEGASDTEVDVAVQEARMNSGIYFPLFLVLVTAAARRVITSRPISSRSKSSVRVSRYQRQLVVAGGKVLPMSSGEERRLCPVVVTAITP
ncbi:MAG: hypothetical protein WD646_01670 [Actinomycetota bacterium]